MYLNNRNPEAAITILESLHTARNPSIATRSSEMIDEVRGMKNAIAAGENVIIRGLLDGEEVSTEPEPPTRSRKPPLRTDRLGPSPDPNSRARAQIPTPELSGNSNIQSLWPKNK